MKYLRRTHALAPVILAAALGLLAASPAMADIYQETGDAGESLATALITTGMPTAIRGSLSGSVGGDAADLYRVYLNAGDMFKATTTASSISYNNFDSSLFLFDSTGHGLVDLPPPSRASVKAVKSINPENDGHEEEQIHRRADHWLPAPS